MHVLVTAGFGGSTRVTSICNTIADVNPGGFKRLASLAAALLVSAALGACGDDDEPATSTVTETKTTTSTVTETTPAPTSEDMPPVDPGAGEAADLPPCSEGVLPCLNPDGSVTEEPEGEGSDGSGEIADLPLCSEGPPPCRTPGGELVEP